MNTRLYVGSLPYAATELDLKEIFEAYGRVVYIRILKNSETQLSRGFGFVEMASPEEGEDALQLNGAIFNKRKLIVKEAWDNEDYKNRHAQDEPLE